MPKLLQEKEAEEIINTMLDDYGLTRIVVVDRNDRWETPDVPYFVEKRFLWWKWKKKVVPTKSWVSASDLVSLVRAVEEELSGWDEDVEETEKIRREHATRLLNKELEKPNGAQEEVRST